MLEAVTRFIGVSQTAKFFETVNRRIRSRPADGAKSCLFIVGGDLNADLRSNSYSLLDIPIDADVCDLVHSVYLYLCTMTNQIVARLQEYIRGDYVFFAGGGMIRNRLLMEYKASILDRPLHLLDIGELSALGAVFCVLQGMGRTAVMEAAISGTSVTRVDPDNGLRRILGEMSKAMIERYRCLRRQKDCDVLQLISRPQPRI